MKNISKIFGIFFVAGILIFSELFSVRVAPKSLSDCRELIKFQTPEMQRLWSVLIRLEVVDNLLKISKEDWIFFLNEIGFLKIVLYGFFSNIRGKIFISVACLEELNVFFRYLIDKYRWMCEHWHKPIPGTGLKLFCCEVFKLDLVDIIIWSHNTSHAVNNSSVAISLFFFERDQRKFIDWINCQQKLLSDCLIISPVDQARVSAKPTSEPQSSLVGRFDKLNYRIDGIPEVVSDGEDSV